MSDTIFSILLQVSLGEKIQGFACLVVILSLAGAALFFAFRAFFRSQKLEKDQRANANQRLPELLQLLEDSPADRSIHAEIVSLVRSNRDHAPAVYSAALNSVEQAEGDTACKQFALETGRIHYSSLRDNGQPTVYDEQAIQNDIVMRTK